MKTIYLVSSGLYWYEQGKPDKEIYLMGIFKWQKQGHEIIFINGVFGNNKHKSLVEIENE